jgi:hypothetical protein
MAHTSVALLITVVVVVVVATRWRARAPRALRAQVQQAQGTKDDCKQRYGAAEPCYGRKGAEAIHSSSGTALSGNLAARNFQFFTSTKPHQVDRVVPPRFFRIGVVSDHGLIITVAAERLEGAAGAGVACLVGESMSTRCLGLAAQLHCTKHQCIVSRLEALHLNLAVGAAGVVRLCCCLASALLSGPDTPSGVEADKDDQDALSRLT